MTYRQKQIVEGLKALLVDQQGSTAIEYGLIASLVALTSMEAMEALASALTDSFTQTSTAMAGANGNSGDPEQPYEPPVAAGDAYEPPIAAMRIG
ncbi:MAG: Flp family type IVb pilin [Sphingomonadaceae bacterium]|nr:Flp family type IVb pilin [Sphingomonadaceae bacterium]